MARFRFRRRIEYSTALIRQIFTVLMANVGTNQLRSHGGKQSRSDYMICKIAVAKRLLRSTDAAYPPLFNNTSHLVPI